ncbi:Uncharacterized protein FWK35_00016665 [Aphis craccivora]|uniref:Uncharacterized protein n=1 Tax=Aphis craccivora TaxID=307492 RepID=A0A6G0YAF5_APHCR|nr:Uncharacterized protein FWK35_00016665 [Aphis craccivora]
MPADQVFGRIEKDLRQIENIISPQEYYKMQLKKIIKKTDFKSTEQKCFSYIKGKKTVGISQTYEGEPIRVPKRDDVKKLLKYFNIPPDAKDFYNDILNDEVTETSAEEDCQEYEKYIL